MSDNITQFPIVPRPLPPKARVIPIRDYGDAPTPLKTEEMVAARGWIDHAVRRATAVAERNKELPWLIRMLESEIAKLKDKANG